MDALANPLDADVGPIRLLIRLKLDVSQLQSYYISIETEEWAPAHTREAGIP